MALSKKELLIPLDQGLNTYGNPHRMKAGSLIGANGVGLDKDGYVYPANQLSNYAAAGGAIGPIRWNSGTYTASGSSATDVLLAHTSSISSAPALNVATGGNASTSPPVYPFTQATQVVEGSSFLYTGTTNDSIGAPVCAISGNFYIYAWISLQGVPCFMREDITTGEREAPLYAVNSTNPPFSNRITSTVALPGVQQKIAVIPNFVAGVATGFVIAFFVGSSTSLSAYTITGPLGGPQFSSLGLTGTSFFNIDAGYDATQSYLLANDNNTLRCWRSGNGFASATTFTTAGTLTATSPICVVPNSPYDTPTSLAFATGTSTTGAVQFVFTNPTFTSPSSSTFGYGSLPIVQIAAGTSNGSTAWAFEVVTTVSSNSKSFTWNQVIIETSTAGTAPNAISGTARSFGGMALLGKPWMNSLGVGDTNAANALFPMRSGWFVSPGGASSSQIAYPNAYLIDVQANTISKWGDRDVGSPLTYPAFDNANYVGSRLPCMSQPMQPTKVSATYAWPQLSYSEGSSTAATTFGMPVNPQVDVAKVTFNQQMPNTTRFVQSGTSLLAPESLNVVHDGSLTYESGYLTSCPQPIVTLTTSGALTVSSTYNYVGVMLYVDASGRFNYSAPSLPVTVTTGSTAGQGVAVTFPTMFPTLKGVGITQIRFLLYRTVAGGSSGTTSGAAYYLVNSSSYNTLSFPISFSPQFTAVVNDGASDTAVLAAPKIYTSSYSAAASAGTTSPPPFFSTAVWQNCMVGVAYRNGWELWLSWPLDQSVFQPEGIPWSAANRVSIPADVGQVQGIATLDSNLIIFGTLRDYALTGTPPARSSSQLDNPTINPVIQLPTPSGVRVRNGITTIPTGLIFQGTTGFMILDRSLTYNDVGNGVTDATNNYLYGTGVLYAQSNCVMFPPIGPGLPLSYYYEEGVWSVPCQSATGVSNWNQVVGLSPFRFNGLITNVGLSSNLTSPLVQLGGNATYMQAITPWIEMANESSTNQIIPSVAGYGQLYEVQVQGDLRTDISFPYTLTLQTEYDYANNTQTPPDVQVVSVADSSLQVPGPADLNWRFGFTTGQARRVRFTLTFDATAGNFSLPLSTPLVAFSGLMLYYGVDDGLSRLGQGYSSATGS